MKYVLLPSPSLDTVKDVLLYDGCKGTLNYIINNHIFKKDMVLCVPGELLCLKWSYDLLEEYGDSSHILSHEYMYMYYAYFRLIVAGSTAAYDVVCSILRQNCIAADSCPKDILKHLEYLGYWISIPEKKFNIRVSLSKVKNNFGMKALKQVSFDMLIYGLAHIIIARVKSIYINICLKIHRIRNGMRTKRVVKELSHIGVINCERITTSSSTGALTFSGNVGDEKIFIKAYDFLGNDYNENYCYDVLEKKYTTFSPNHYRIKNKHIVITRYMFGRTLSSCNNTIFSEDDYSQLEMFLHEVVGFFYNNNYSYNDLRPDNILISYVNGNIKYTLCDYGSAQMGFVFGKKSLLNKLFEQYVGEEFRYSKKIKNDAVSALRILFQYCPANHKVDYGFYVEMIKPLWSELLMECI